MVSLRGCTHRLLWTFHKSVNRSNLMPRSGRRDSSGSPSLSLELSSYCGNEKHRPRKNPEENTYTHPIVESILTGKVKRSYNGKQEYADYVNHPVYHPSGFTGPQSQFVFNKLKVNVHDANVMLNNPQVQARMGLTRKQSSPSNIFVPLAKLTRQDGYLWSATQHTHPNDDAPDNDRLHWHLLIGINEERSTRLRQTETYKTLKSKIEPLSYKTHTTEKPVHCAIYGVFGKDIKDDPERLFLGTNNKQILSVLQQVKLTLWTRRRMCTIG